jgi:hypothetical protein
MENKNKLSAGERFITRLIFSAFVLFTATLFVFWFFASWFPELGYTYWQLVLPVFIVRMIFSWGSPTAHLTDEKLDKLR